MLTQMATYVENVSGGDRAMIESAGFSVRADSAPVGTLARVLNLVLTAGALILWSGGGSFFEFVQISEIRVRLWTFRAARTVSRLQ